MSMNVKREPIGVVSAPNLPSNNVSIKFDLAQRQAFYNITPPKTKAFSSNALQALEQGDFFGTLSGVSKKQLPSPPTLQDLQEGNTPSVTPKKEKGQFARKFVGVANIALIGTLTYFTLKSLKDLGGLLKKPLTHVKK